MAIYVSSLISFHHFKASELQMDVVQPQLHFLQVLFTLSHSCSLELPDRFFRLTLWWQKKGLVTSQYRLVQRHISFIVGVELLSISTHLNT